MRCPWRCVSWYTEDGQPLRRKGGGWLTFSILNFDMPSCAGEALEVNCGRVTVPEVETRGQG